LIPRQANPNRVYTIVHTGSGTYRSQHQSPGADLADVSHRAFLAPGVPAQTNAAFVSLESITYP
jgi:hypothetical protein